MRNLENKGKYNALTIIATTHYALLSFLVNKPDSKLHFDMPFQNATMDLDEINYKPTYRLKIGIPGKSFTLDIAERMNLNREIVNKAKSIIKQKNKMINTLITSLNVYFFYFHSFNFL